MDIKKFKEVVIMAKYTVKYLTDKSGSLSRICDEMYVSRMEIENLII